MSRRVTSVSMWRNVVAECARTFSVNGGYSRVSCAQVCVGLRFMSSWGGSHVFYNYPLRSGIGNKTSLEPVR